MILFLVTDWKEKAMAVCSFFLIVELKVYSQPRIIGEARILYFVRLHIRHLICIAKRFIVLNLYHRLIYL